MCIRQSWDASNQDDSDMGNGQQRLMEMLHFLSCTLPQDIMITSAQLPINAQQTKTGAKAARHAGYGNAMKWE